MVAVLVLLAAPACKKPSLPKPPTPAVRVVPVQTQRVPLVREFLATLEGSTTAEIHPQVTGYITAVTYREGSIVEPGQILFTINKRPFIAAVDKAQGDYEKALAELQKSRADVTRYAPLVGQRAVSKEQLDNARSAVREGEANVKATKAALEQAKINLDWTDVRSPIRGLAGLAQVRVGSLVSTTQVLTVVSTLDPMRVSFSIPQQDYVKNAAEINSLDQPGESAGERYAELVLADGSVYPLRSTRAVVNRQVDPQTGTLQMQAFFPNPKNVLRPGLFGKVRAHIGKEVDAPMVPERAIIELQGRQQVAVVDDQQRVVIRPVKLGPSFDHSYIVEAGVNPGERVIVEGQQNALPGTKVNVAPMPMQARPAPPQRRATDGVQPGAEGPQ